MKEISERLAESIQSAQPDENGVLTISRDSANLFQDIDLLTVSHNLGATRRFDSLYGYVTVLEWLIHSHGTHQNLSLYIDFVLGKMTNEQIRLSDALHLVIKLKKYDLALNFIENNKFDLNQRSLDGLTPIAALMRQCGQSNRLKANSDASPDAEDRGNPASDVAGGGQPETSVSHNSDSDSAQVRKAPLVSATEVLTALLDKPALSIAQQFNIHIEILTLSWTFFGLRIAMLERLFTHHFQLNEKTPLYLAIFLNLDWVLAKLLRKQDAEDATLIDASQLVNGENALHLAVKLGRPDCLEVILAHQCECLQMIHPNHTQDDVESTRQPEGGAFKHLVAFANIPSKVNFKHDKTALRLAIDSVNHGVALNIALQNIAILLCHGASLPMDSNEMKFLIYHSHEIMARAVQYFQDSKQGLLACEFFHHAHDKNHPLSKLVYQPAYSSFIQRFNPWASIQRVQLLASLTSSFPYYFTQDEQNFSKFITAYLLRLHIWSNPFSQMYNALVAGNISGMSSVSDYVGQRPNSRTGKFFEQWQNSLLTTGTERHPLPSQ